MDLRKQNEVRETQTPETEKVSGEVQSMAEAQELFDKIMSMEDDKPEETRANSVSPTP